MPKKMTNAQYNAMVEMIAKRVEEQTEMTPSKAAEMIREAKTDDAKKATQKK